MKTINPDNWVPLKNKYETKCKTCEQMIEVGEKVMWKKGTGVKHESCDPPEMEKTQPIISEKEWERFSTIQVQGTFVQSRNANVVENQ